MSLSFIQEEYFSKKGMSLLGFMVMIKATKIEEVQEGHKIFHKKIVYLEYYFFDTVVENYSAQDHIQVASLLNVRNIFSQYICMWEDILQR
jgi:hypothetical protein